MQSRKKIRFSIFLKLILLIVVFIALVNFAIGFFIRFSISKEHLGSFRGGPPPPPFIGHVLKELGTPPDTSKAKALCGEFNTNIRIETQNIKWTSDPDVPEIDDLRDEKAFDETKDIFMIDKNRRPFSVAKIENGFVIFTPRFPRDYINFEKAIPAIIVIVTVLCTLLYFSLRWIFGPVRKLSEAVNQISSGNFDAELDVRRNDELGNLANSINEMKQSISEMIKSKETLLIDVSHELRSPLTRIKIAAEFIGDEKVRTTIREDVAEMEAMVTGLLETYRMRNASENGTVSMQQTDIVELTKNLIRKFENSRINFKSEFDKRYVSLNKERIEIALRNIIDNALKYSDSKSVDINIFENTAMKSKTNVLIKDYGKGIEKEEIEKIFEPFYRIDKSRGKKISGYGLGLSLVKKILNDHKAEIVVNSTPGSGTEFLVIFK